MNASKEKILKNICYTDLVYGRINKKLGIDLSREQTEEFILSIIEKTEDRFITRKGKNYYIVNSEKNIRLTVNANTFRIITADKLTERA